MDILLDTHSLLWLLEDNPRLPQHCRNLLFDTSVKKYVSVASFWEIAIKQSLGKLQIKHPLPDIPLWVENAGYVILPVQTSHALAVASLVFHHKDPFDRLLIAQAQVEQLVIMTKDPDISKYHIHTVWEEASVVGENSQTIEKTRIVFMGTPEFAVASLDALVKNNFNVVGVITAPDKPAGRGMKLQESAVKRYAEENGLRVLQPEKLKNPQFLEELKSLNADLQVVVAFRMLPEAVWNMPPMGTINVHGSLLPQYRGAAPINWAIINGESETGVTTFKLKHEIDTGDILLQERIPIGENETAGELHDRMKELGASLLVETVNGLIEGTLTETPQQTVLNGISEIKHAPKIFTETCKIDWSKPVHQVHNLVRGLSPHPGAFTLLNGKTLKIYRSIKEEKSPSIPSGDFETDRKTFLRFACSDGYIQIKELQLEGKKKLEVEEFLRGYRFE
jgi:methionyl-tRNA formyltransferase